MKKLLAMILIIALAVPAAAGAAGAEDRDPVIGCWYSVYDKELVPEMAANFNNCDLNVNIFIFSDEGIIYTMVNEITNHEGNPLYGALGKWEKNDGVYTYSIIGIGSGTFTIEDDNLWMNFQSKYDVLYRKMVPFNPYTDYRY